MKKIFFVFLVSFLFIISKPSMATSSKFVLPSGVNVTIVELPFKLQNFIIEGCINKSLVCLINNNIPFGITMDLPKTFVKSIIITNKKKSYNLDVTDMYNAWGNRPLSYQGSVRYFGGNCFDANNCKIRGIFSDAAGSFVAEWIISDGIVFRTILTDSNDVINLFIKYIDPPVFD